MKRILRALAGLAVIALGLFAAKVLIGMKEERPVMSPPKAIKLVKTMPAKIGLESPTSQVKGRAVALDRIELFAEVSGVVLPAPKPFRAGVRFNKGETLLRMDAGEQELSLVAQRSNFLQLLTGALADLKIDYADQYDKWRNYTARLEVAKVLDELPPLATDQEKFFISNRGILNQYYAIRSAEERLSKFALTAPFTGEVTQSSVNPGTLVRVGQKIGDFVSPDGFEIESAIARESLAVIEVGDSVHLTADGVDRIILGRVSRVLTTIDPMTQTAKVFIAADDPVIRDGMYLTGTVFSRPIDEVMRLDRDLLIDNQRVFSVVDDTLLTSVSVDVRFLNQYDALVSGLPAGCTLVAEPVANGFDGMTVKLANE
jgi:multidrug efflux pump subunit AcrA (membrane-fusion protein)